MKPETRRIDLGGVSGHVALPREVPDPGVNPAQMLNLLSTDGIGELSVMDLLACYARICDQLRQRGVLRSGNNPTGDLAEYLFCRAFGWQQAKNSVRGYDATDADGVRYQIKARRIMGRGSSRELSAIRDIKDGHFDVLAGLLFDSEFKVQRAALIPISCVIERSSFSAHTKSSKFMLRDEVWRLPEVRDVTMELRSVRV